MSASTRCCDRSFTRFFFGGFAVLSLLAAGFMTGKSASPGTASSLFASGIPALDTASGGKSLSLATGLIEPNYEALYALDHLTGELSCYLLNTRSGEVQAHIHTNVAAQMGVTGEADYVLTTGFMDFSGGVTDGGRPANSVVYVGDGNTGRVVGFVLFYNKQALMQGNLLGSQLRLICQMESREVNAIRGQDDR